MCVCVLVVSTAVSERRSEMFGQVSKLLYRGGGSGMASMAQAISIVKTVWLSHTITKRPPTLF